jgi:hypothetical protein
MSRVFPSLQDLRNYKTKLTEGENALVGFLDKHLPGAYRIYVQPYVNDMRPDVVVINPNIGMVVFEVKDWDLSRYSFQKNKLIASTLHNTWVEEDPVQKVNWYARSFFEQFLISDESDVPIGTDPNNNAICRAVAYFHCSSTNQVNALYGTRGMNVIKAGQDLLNSKGLRTLVPYFWMPKSKFIRISQIEALKNAHSWLVPPNHAISQACMTKLFEDQEPYAIPESGFRRIRGVAGAGKTIVLSHRAARSNQQGRKIAVLCFNITMSHILRDKINQTPFQVDWTRLTWGHFHAFVKKQGVESGLIISKEEEESEKPDALTINPGELLKQILKNENLAPSYTAPKFDGIYIDEGQDFEQGWLDSLAGMLKPGGELVLFADHRQNIYAKDGGSDKNKKMTRCKFFGPWGQLPRKSHRLPPRLASFLNEYAQKAGLGDEEDFPINYSGHEPGFNFSPDLMVWKNVGSIQDGINNIESALNLIGNTNPGDVVVLLPSHESGLIAVKQLLPKFRQIVHVFGEGGSDSPESRRRKLAFWMGRGGLKMSTIHSFKGWEIDNVILIWPPKSTFQDFSEHQRHALFYTAISRVIKNMVVLNANREYDCFDINWDKIKFGS